MFNNTGRNRTTFQQYITIFKRNNEQLSTYNFVKRNMEDGYKGVMAYITEGIEGITIKDHILQYNIGANYTEISIGAVSMYTGSYITITDFTCGERLCHYTNETRPRLYDKTVKYYYYQTDDKETLRRIKMTLIEMCRRATKLLDRETEFKTRQERKRLSVGRMQLENMRKSD